VRWKPGFSATTLSTQPPRARRRAAICRLPWESRIRRLACHSASVSGDRRSDSGEARPRARGRRVRRGLPVPETAVRGARASDDRSEEASDHSQAGALNHPGLTPRRPGTPPARPAGESSPPLLALNPLPSHAVPGCCCRDHSAAGPCPPSAVGESELPLEILSRIARPRVIARGTAIRELPRLQRTYGPGRWCKMKGTARVRLPDGCVALAEVHWYQAHGIGRREFKLKRLLDGHDDDSL
jgi:hypothetical protein